MNYSCGKYIDVPLSQKQTMTAYEELKAWCEKHLNECDWYTHACANHQTRLCIVDAHADFFFNEDGSLDWIDN